jgi:D-alanyl-D-alanine carboxypeptidase
MKESRRDKATRRKRVIAIIVSAIMLLSVCIPLGVMTVYAAPEDERAEDTSDVDFSGDPTVIGDAGVLMESETGKVLFEQNADKQQFPA